VFWKAKRDVTREKKELRAEIAKIEERWADDLKKAGQDE